MSEEFKIINGFDNYMVSNFGNVKNTKTGRILKASIDSEGYYKVSLSKEGKSTTKNNHRLVAIAFLENLENKNCVDHINNNKLNNNLTNLRWATTKENSQNQKLSSNNKSGQKGITFYKPSNKWCAQITIDGIGIHLGYFVNKEDAINARVLRAYQVFGVFTNACEQTIITL